MISSTSVMSTSGVTLMPVIGAEGFYVPGSGNMIRASRDGGRTFETRTAPGDFGIAMLASTSVGLVVGMSEPAGTALYRSGDGGRTWQAMPRVTDLYARCRELTEAQGVLLLDCDTPDRDAPAECVGIRLPGHDELARAFRPSAIGVAKRDVSNQRGKPRARRPGPASRTCPSLSRRRNGVTPSSHRCRSRLSPSSTRSTS